MHTQQLTESQLPKLSQLLQANHLPTDDLHDAPMQLIGIFQHEELIAAVGLEQHGRFGLLRSLAVDDRFKGAGLGRQLVHHIVQQAQQEGLQTLYLLTTTAHDYFLRHGFATCPRESVPPEIERSSQFSSICPVSAVLMSRSLSSN